MTASGREPVAALDRVKLIECGEPLVEVRGSAILIARETTIPWAREGVAKILAEAASKLPSGVRLGVTEAWRPLQRQMRGYDNYYNELRARRPDWPLSTLKRQANRFFHPYDRKAPPGHCTGGAVDVRLFDESGKEMELAAPYDKWDGAPTYVRGLSAEAHRNRALLVETMLGVGFSNCLQEFWHYSFGDAAWAVRTGRASCRYGFIELEEELWREQERRALQLFHEAKQKAASEPHG